MIVVTVVTVVRRCGARTAGRPAAAAAAALALSAACLAGPGNNACSNALDLALGETPFSNLGATTDGPSPCGPLGADVWYDFTAEADGIVTFSLCGSSFDTVLAVYNGCGCPASPITLLGCNDNFCGLQSQVSITATEGSCYKVQVAGKNGQQGDGTITVTSQAGPGNDDCHDAFSVDDGQVLFSNTLATTDGASPCGLLGSDIWFNYTASVTGSLTLATCGSGFDTVIAVYDGCDCETAPLIACNDDAGPASPCFGTGQSQLTVSVGAGQCYKIQVGGFSGAQGQGVLSVLGDVCPGTGACFVANGSPGCDNAGCCETVCQTDAACCTVEWDQTCADAALEQCNNDACPGTGDCFMENGSVGCDDEVCCNIVCLIDAFCCEVIWDAQCGETALEQCGGTCPGDVDGSGAVDVSDLTIVILDWGCVDPPGPCEGDANGDGVVNVQDLTGVILAWGACN